MECLEALAVVEAAVAISRTNPHALPLDVLDLVMRGREGQPLRFIEKGFRHASLADPSTPFDDGMVPGDLVSLTGDRPDAGLRSYLLDLWRCEGSRRSALPAGPW